MFYVAFVPLLISPYAAYWPQAAILMLTFGIIVGCTDTLYALLASAAGNVLNRPFAAKWSARAGGIVLILAGLFAVTARRA